jgi:LPS-assembly lipoprotein
VRTLLGLLSLAALSACGLRPLYEGGSQGNVVRSLRSVDVGPIGGRAGWLVRTALVDRLQAPEGAAPRYRLEVELDDRITGFGIRSDDAVTRERRTLRARYRLIDASSGTVLIDATAGSDAGIDVVSSEYATVAAEQTALERLSREIADQIVSRLALYAARTAGRPVKAKRDQVERALRAPGDTRFFLFYGPDEAGSQSLVKAMAAAAGPEAERIDLSGASSRPTRAARGRGASISLFAGRASSSSSRPATRRSPPSKRCSRLRRPAIPSPSSPGALKPTSKLVKLALAEPSALALASYVPEGRDAERLVADMARAEGLLVRPDLARRIADACAGNRSIIEQELRKLALYADASPRRRGRSTMTRSTRWARRARKATSPASSIR